MEVFFGAVLERKRDNYIFVSINEGCGYKLSVFSKDLVKVKRTGEELPDRALDAVNGCWPAPTEILG